MIGEANHHAEHLAAAEGHDQHRADVDPRPQLPREPVVERTPQGTRCREWLDLRDPGRPVFSCPTLYLCDGGHIRHLRPYIGWSVPQTPVDGQRPAAARNAGALSTRSQVKS